jgi:2-C-methyl-D-erythritol 4-phosphate cytidylyltransferase
VKKNSAIILAAGKETEWGGRGKIFLPLLGKNPCGVDLLVFEASPEIRENILVVPRGEK